MMAQSLNNPLRLAAKRDGKRVRWSVESQWLEVSGLRIHARIAGEGPPVVLVHGYGVSSSYMLPLAQSLAPSFSVFAPDLPGFGRSQRPRRPAGIAELAAALAGWLDTAGLQRPAFVANSMGCQIVTELAVRFPGRVGPMVLIGPTVDPQRRAARHQLLAGLRDAGREPGSLLALAARDDAVAGVGALVATARSALADRIEERLPLIAQPTLVVRGEHDGFVGQRWAEMASALLPRGRLVIVPCEPHAVHYTRPDLIARIALELLGEEGEQAGSQLPRRLPHRHVSASKAHEPGAGQDSLPLRGDPRREEPVVIAPHEQRPGLNRRELQAQVSVGCEHRSAKETEGPSPHRVADERR
jgi:2-hydroxy-6-oxonona-2,4-dienedioate hydrolase